MGRGFARKKIAYENSNTEEGRKYSPLLGATTNKQKQTQKALKGIEENSKYIIPGKQFPRVYKSCHFRKGQDNVCDQINVFTELLYSHSRSLY